MGPFDDIESLKNVSAVYVYILQIDAVGLGGGGEESIKMY